MAAQQDRPAQVLAENSRPFIDYAWSNDVMRSDRRGLGALRLPGKIQITALWIRAHQFHLKLIADIHSLLTANEKAFPRGLEIANIFGAKYASNPCCRILLIRGISLRSTSWSRSGGSADGKAPSRVYQWV